MLRHSPACRFAPWLVVQCTLELAASVAHAACWQVHIVQAAMLALLLTLAVGVCAYGAVLCLTGMYRLLSINW